jgi:hypothetical protein
MASNRMSNFLSTHPYYQRFNVALSFARRVFSLCDKTFFQKNSTIVYNILRKNNYPLKVINRVISKSIHMTKLSNNNNNYTNNSKEKTDSMYIGHPYVPHLSPALQNVIRQDTPNIQVAFRPVSKIGQTIFTNTKDKQDKMSKSGIVYKIDCKNCDKSYVGETSKKLMTRLHRHELDVLNKEKSGPKTALVQHTLDTKHNFDFENPQILDNETKHGKRLILEAGHIVMNKTVNLKTDARNISKQYYTILDTFKKNNSEKPKIKITNTNNLPTTPKLPKNKTHPRKIQPTSS